MATKKQAGRRTAKRRSAPRKKQAGGGFAKLLKTTFLSAAVSFAAMLWALHPQLLDQIGVDRILANLEQAQPRQDVASTRQAAPAGHDGHVQTSFAQCREFFPHQTPPVVPARPTQRELCFSSFAILYSGQRKTPVLVAERLNRQTLIAAQSIARTDSFYEEARLPASERAGLDDYRGSGFDRGHMAPAGDMPDDQAMAQSFSLANMIPQAPQANRGAWNKIEQDTRKYVMRAKGDVYVISGPVYSDHPQTIGAARVAVPDYTFKVVFDATTGRSWVHWLANSPDARPGAPISYEEFVKRTGLQVLG
ncbi:MAG: DNA/RNA non-specific endonuclease [Castellaniella sp.]|nr:DNA/RNA non-specific endonuclease [Castellaniella sp.]